MALAVGGMFSIISLTGQIPDILSCTSMFWLILKKHFTRIEHACLIDSQRQNGFSGSNGVGKINNGTDSKCSFLYQQMSWLILKKYFTRIEHACLIDSQGQNGFSSSNGADKFKSGTDSKYSFLHQHLLAYPKKHFTRIEHACSIDRQCAFKK